MASQQLTGIIVAGARAALSALVPVACAGCESPGRSLCDDCRAHLRPRLRHRRVGELEVVCALSLEGVPERVLRTAKDDARPRLIRCFGPALRAALAEEARRYGAGAPLRAVPVPPSARSLAERGFAVVPLLLESAGVRPERVLRQRHAAADQRGLSRGARMRNVRDTLCARAPRTRRSRSVVVVDDVVTTGATLREAQRALAAAGWSVVGAVALAATPEANSGRQMSISTANNA